jgi:hypothetical protein
MVYSKQAQLEQIKKDVDMLGLQEAQAEGPILEIKFNKENLEEEKDDASKNIDVESMAQQSYRHMIERHRRDLTASRIQTAEMEVSLKSKQQILELEDLKFRKTKESKLQSKNIIESLMRNIEKEQKDRHDRIMELQRCIKNKEESVQRRIERQKRNQDIAEAAANENKDSSELKMRESLYIQKLWNAFMRKKMEREMKGSHSIDEAFKAIKTATGIVDVQMMVSNFLTREETYSQLLMQVSEYERKIDQLRKDNEDLRARLHDLQMNDESKAGGPSGGEADEFKVMREEISGLNKNYSDMQQKFKRVNIVSDQIQAWTKRVYGKFMLMGGNDGGQKAEDLVSMFTQMNEQVQNHLAKLGEEQKQKEEAGDDVDYIGVFTDFATQEFVDKNIRVRPASGVTHDETRDGRQSSVSKGQHEDEAENQTNNKEKLNKIILSDLEDIRKKIKVEKRNVEEENLRKQLLKEKEDEKKRR